MSVRGKVVGTALSVGVIAGCSVAAEVAPEILSKSYSSPVDLCASNNPNYGQYDPSRPVAKQLGVSVSHDPNRIPPTLTPEQTDKLERGIEEIYEVDIIFPEKTATEGIYTYKAALHGTDNDQVIKSRLLQYTVSAWSFLPTKLVTDSDPERVVFTPNLTDHSGAKTARIGGSYVAETGTMYINYGYSEQEQLLAEQRVFHETMHGIDVNVTCGANDHEVDKDFAGNTLYVNYEDPDKFYNPSAFQVGPKRKFYNKHSADNVMEDRTTALTSAVYGRGLVQPGDPDYGSDFDKSQRKAVERLNAMVPGIKEEIEKRTIFVRDDTSNELNTVS